MEAKKETNLRDIQLVALNILVHFQTICKRHNLRYFAIGGTCIGAVRHNGFIPWDDDIDVVMPYPDYAKFKDIAKTEIPHYFEISDESNTKYRGCYIKLHDSRTTFIEHKYIPYPDHYQGVFIDIFPLYGMPNNPKEFRKRYRQYVLWTYQNYIIRYPYHYHKRIWAKMFYFLNTYAILTKPYYYYQQKIENVLGQYSFEKSNEIIFGWRMLPSKKSTYKLVFPTQYFEDYEEVPFENISIRIPVEYDAYLKDDFGDYMKLPPIEQQRSTHPDTFIDLGRSYKEYIEKGVPK